MSSATENILGIIFRTHWKLDGNALGTKKIQHTSPHRPPKKKIVFVGCMLAHLIGCRKFLCLPLFFTIFGLG